MISVKYSYLSGRNKSLAPEKSYRDALAAIKDSGILSSSEAMNKINKLSEYYDQNRASLPPGSKRTRLMEELSSMLWSLMPSVKNFPLRERLNSWRSDDRLSAYKYLEYKPGMDNLDLLISSAIGVLEEPFGQYAALLALRRLVINVKTGTLEKELITRNLTWIARLEFMGSDREYLMNSIVSLLEKREKNN